MFSVASLTRYLRELFETDEILQDVWVQGEISNLSRPSSGHVYFTLKDQTTALRCVIWKNAALRLRFALQNGITIEAHGAISLYERDGTYQLYIDTLRPAGEGLLYQEFLRLKARLEAEGLFDAERKRPLPALPRRIGIVTSPTGAALQDMLNTLSKRYPLAEVVISPCAVQGESAPGEIVAALGRLVRLGGVDLILVARGGGSLEDLWAFNDEGVVRAIAESPVPVVTGIGHETDFTLADFASDLRAPTPTGAAVLATPDIDDLGSGLESLVSRLGYGLQSATQRERSRLESVRMQLERSSPRWRIRSDRQQVDDLARRAERAAGQHLVLRRTGLNGLRTHLFSLSPLAVLQRGYAIVSAPDGQVVRSAGQVQPGDGLKIRVADGQIAAQVVPPSISDHLQAG